MNWCLFLIANGTDDLVFFEKDETPAPANEYSPLSSHDNEHHDGATLRWAAAASVTECQQACDQTVKVSTNHSQKVRYLRRNVH